MKSTNGAWKGPARHKPFGLALVALLSSSLLHCAGTPEIVLPVIPPCPSPSWDMIGEIEKYCSLGDNPFAFCPGLYNYLEDVMRYCEEIDELRK